MIAMISDGLYALLSDQPGWSQLDQGNDGLGIEVTPFAHSSALGDVHVYYNRDGRQRITGRNSTSFPANTAGPFSSPWSGVAAIPGPSGFLPVLGGPQLADVPNGQVAMVVSKQTASGLQAGVFLSSDGTSWTRLTSLNGPTDQTIPGSTIYGAGTAAAPVMFVNAWGKLYRIEGTTSPTITPLLPGRTVGAFAAADAHHERHGDAR